MNARSRFLARFQGLMQIAMQREARDKGAQDADAHTAHHHTGLSRRGMLRRAAAGAGLLATWPAARAARAARGGHALSVGIVGAGLAGLHAARLLQDKGAQLRVFDADTRVGGRVWSLRGFFPGQVAERGGELIDTSHHTLRRLARQFGLHMESYRPSQHPGEEFFYFGGRAWSEAEVVAQFQAFLPAIKRDLRMLSPAPTPKSHSDYDRELDLMPLSAYLESRGASPLIRAVLDTAYTIEFGREIEHQSALTMLLYIGTRRSRSFKPFGSSDERFHIVEGNDAVPRALAAGLAEPVQAQHRLVAVACHADGRVRLSFDTPAGPRDSDHDAVVLAIPAPMMRQIHFAPSVPLGEGNRFAIQNLDYGTSSKTMLGFVGRPWWEGSRSNGASTSDLANHQTTWETNPSLAINTERGVLTDFSGGERGARLDPTHASEEAEKFLSDLERIYPGSAAQARRGSDGRVVAHLENWSKHPLFMGGYTNNQPGYFTSLEGLYAEPAGRVCFAGEHTDSFYSYQGFMEGALLSGARAADEVLRKA